ncbi:ACP S-malonyltransferase [Streptomyces sp. NPDC053499]|uniref:ACP S-malonyltransferase n=1 Tax=Streptomyces sp. NPDC053499 TaxID=3365707 RepID=UPI0037CD2789
MSMTAFVFPGQGSQRVGMADVLRQECPQLYAERFAAAEEILRIPLAELCREGPAETLRAMPVTQPAVFLTSVVTYEMLRERGIEPDVVAGHSLGEFAAMVAAGVLEWTDGLRLVRLRGELMESVNRTVPGSMGAVVGVAVGELERLCAQARTETGEVVEIANHNDHRQYVVSGHVDGVARLLELAAGAGAERVLTLEVGGSAHCSLLSGIEAEFAQALAGVTLRDPASEVVSAVTAAPVRSAREAAECLRRQFTSRVLWADTVLRLADGGVGRFVEVGPGKALSRLCARLCPEAEVHRTNDAARLGRLYAAAGVTTRDGAAADGSAPGSGHGTAAAGPVPGPVRG